MDNCRSRESYWGIVLARKYNEFHLMMYRDLLLDQYKYRKLPAWFLE